MALAVVDAEEPEILKNATPNTWVKLVETETGSRQQPLFVHASGIGKFVMAGGTQGRGSGIFPRHYDTEEFELATARWLNAYPAGAEKGRPASGPLGDAYANEREKHGYDGARGPFYDDGGFQRIVAGGQWARTVTNGFAWCYAPDTGLIYVSPGEQLFVYDTAARTWELLPTQPRETGLVWGSMCYDPLNKEILHSGGGGGSADVSTWVFNIGKNEWRRLDSGRPRLRALFDRATDLRWQAKTLLGRCSSRHAAAETAEEAQVSLPAEAEVLMAAAGTLAGEIRAAGLAGGETAAGDAAIERLQAASSALKIAGPQLSGEITAEKIGSIRAIRVLLEQVADALAPEPPGRARSQTAYDAIHKKIVLFGGDGLDRTLSDTWLFDCTTRTWEQKFPLKSPAPRAGHILDWLPQAGRIVLAGGYSRRPLAQEIWIYDTAANSWNLLLHAPLAGGASADVPVAGLIQNGAVDGNDVLVSPSNRDRDGRAIWACRIDVEKIDAAGTAQHGVASGTYDFHQIDPATWEKLARPDAGKMQQFYKELPANEWTALDFPKYAPGAQNRWGTSAYDTDRHQVLLWGGGHATSHENDVAHFSLLGGFWTVGYHPDDAIEPTYASQPVPLSFNDRMHVPMHAYNSYSYDPTAGKMFYLDRAYDPLVREWLPKGLPGLGPVTAPGTKWEEVPYHTFLEATPQGAVMWSGDGLFRFNAGAGEWQKLPWEGPAIGAPWCDGHAMVHDSKRNCLWLATDKVIMRYDLATGRAEEIEFKKPSVLGEFILYREAVYLPEADLILTMRLFPRPDGRFSNMAWSPADGKFHWVDLEFREDGKTVEFKDRGFSWSDALVYDPKLQLVVLNNNAASKVWVMKFDHRKAQLEEMKE